MGDPVRRARLGAAARALVEANRGAKDKTLAVIAGARAAAGPRARRRGPSLPRGPLSLLSGLYGRAARFRRAWYGRHPHRVASARSAGHQRRQSRRGRQRQDAGRRGARAAPARRGRTARHSEPRLRPAPIAPTGSSWSATAATSLVPAEAVRRRAADAGAGARRACRCSCRRIGISPAVWRNDGSAAPCTSWTMGFSIVQLARDVDLLVMSRGRSGRSACCRQDGCASRSTRRAPPMRCSSAGDRRGCRGHGARLGVDTGVSRYWRARRRAAVQPFGATLRGSIGRRVVAVAGIARPERFFAALRAEGWDVARELVFRDHHWFTPRDLASIERAAAGDAQADLDHDDREGCRAAGRWWTSRIDRPWAVLPLHVAIEPASFLSWLWIGDRDWRRRARRRGADGGVKSLATRSRFCATGSSGSSRAAFAWSSALLRCRSVRRLGRASGGLAYLVDGPAAGSRSRTWHIAFPGRSAQERKALTRSMFAHFGAAGVRAHQVRHLLARADARGQRRRRRGARPAGACAGTRRPVLHRAFRLLGDLAMAHALRSEPMSVLARPLDNPYLHSMLEDIRTSTGNSVIYRQGAVRRMLRDLAAGRGVAVLIDQHLHRPTRMYVGFFRRPAATTSALAALALRTGAPVIPVFALPLPARPIPLHLRASGGPASRRHARCRARVHAALHRRAGDVRAPASRTSGCGCTGAGAIDDRCRPAASRARTQSVRRGGRCLT